MSKVLVNRSNLEHIADAIREKNGESTTYKPREMAGAIRDIPTGGGGEYWDASARQYPITIGDAGAAFDVSELNWAATAELKSN